MYIRRAAAFAALTTFPSAAWAFCGAYVGGATTNSASVVVLVRQSGVTTLTLVNDYAGAEGTFGYVMPVPAGTSLDEVALVDPAVIERLDAYSAPRLVAYTCDDVSWDWVDDTAGGHWEGSTSGSSGCGSSAAPPDFTQDTSGTSSASGSRLMGDGKLADVEVEERVSVGNYTLAIVHANGSGTLQEWLDARGFTVTDDTRTRLQTYVEAGQDFLVAQVDLDTLPEGQAWLEPLRLRYTSDAITLPLWLGASSSSGTQDLLVLGVTDASSGALAISNYADVDIPDECLVDDAVAYTEGRWEQAVSTNTVAPWVSEFGWLSGKCDPCANDLTLSDEDLAAVGFEGSAKDSYFTRLHLRYHPEQVTEDVVLYESGIDDRWQLRFIEGSPEMTEFFPVCDGVTIAGDDVCEPPEDPPSDQEEPARSGCCGGSAAAVGLLGLGSLLRRRGARG